MKRIILIAALLALTTGCAAFGTSERDRLAFQDASSVYYNSAKDKTADRTYGVALGKWHRVLIRQRRFDEARPVGRMFLKFSGIKVRGGRIPTAPTAPTAQHEAQERANDCRTPDNGGPQMRSLACY
jgi:hypothetical protein